MRTSWAVKSFAKDAGANVVEYYDPPKSAAEHLSNELKAMLAKQGTPAAALQKIYETQNYQFRFVTNEKLTADYQALRKLITEGIWLEGVDQAPYQIEKMESEEKNLGESLQLLASLDGTALDQVESASLLQGIKQSSIDDLSTNGIIKFATLPDNKGKYPQLQELLQKAQAAAEKRDQAIVTLEVIAADNFVRLAEEYGTSAAKLPETWEQSKNKVAETFKSMEPVTPHYASLVKELARFRELAKQPKLPPINPKASAKIGSQGELVNEIQAHLKQEGYWDGALSGKYDEALAEAVKRYQADRQVTEDGKVERVTIERMNVSMAERVKQIKLALHKFRTSATRGGDYFLRVNVAGQELEVYVEGGKKIARHHRLVVGNVGAKNHTPLFSDEVEEIVFNPPWMVPPRIIQDEMLPLFQKDPEYFKKEGYLAKITYNPDGSLKKIQSVTQPAGPSAALGRVKINFPNKDDVYLHDTPLKHLFKRSVRAFSHGCMRLENPLDLARFLLEKDKNPYFEKVDDILAKRATFPVELKTKVPIHIEYVTVSTNDQGKAVFFTDPYNLDADTLEKMPSD